MPSWLLGPDWSGMFVPSQPLLETFLRGSLMYFYLFWLLRILRRQAGQVAPADLLVLVLIADASQNGMAGQYTSLTDGLVLVTTIVLWEYILDYLAFHVPRLRPYIDREPLCLIQNGKAVEKNLRDELITQDELMGYLREHGVEDVSRVKKSLLEGNGRITVITFEKTQDSAPSKPGPV